MALYHYLSDAPFFSISDMERLVNDALSQDGSSGSSHHARQRGATSRHQWQFQPRMDIYENAEHNVITATLELPGLKKEDVNVEIQNNRLIISGETFQEKDCSEKDFVLKERRYGRFSRVIPVPPGIQSGDIKATMENGILSVTFPKLTGEQKPKRIVVE